MTQEQSARTKNLPLAFALIAALGVAACDTPKPVLDLAKVSAANVSIVNTQLQSFAKSSERVAMARTDAMVALDRQVTAAQKELVLKRIALEKAGTEGQSKLSAANQLNEVLKDLEKVENAALTKDGKPLDVVLQARFEASQTELQAPVEPLTAAANSLSDLSKDDDFGAKAKFYGAFIQEVVADIEEAKANQEQASTSVAAAVDATTSKTSAGNLSSVEDNQ